MKGSLVETEAQEGTVAAGGARTSIPLFGGENIASIRRRRSPKGAFDAWPEISARLRAADRCAFFLDFDGTLVNIRSHPGKVQRSRRVERILKRLVAHPNCFVAIVSGRRVRDLRRLVRVDGLRYFGLHGAERGGKLVALRKATKLALGAAKRAAQRQLGGLSGVWIEDKGFSFCVHYRNAGTTVTRTAAAGLEKLLRPWAGLFYVLNGKRIWEVLPRELPGKAAAVQDALAELPFGTPAVYLGDDDTDETAFAVLTDQITIRVGKTPDTHARYWLPAPADVLRFLTRVEKELL
jgi:trehalose 6-phosphate phosphatase